MYFWTKKPTALLDISKLPIWSSSISGYPAKMTCNIFVHSGASEVQIIQEFQIISELCLAFFQDEIQDWCRTLEFTLAITWDGRVIQWSTGLMTYMCFVHKVKESSSIRKLWNILFVHIWWQIFSRNLCTSLYSLAKRPRAKLLPCNATPPSM